MKIDTDKAYARFKASLLELVEDGSVPMERAQALVLHVVALKIAADIA